jgi:uncharacterized protein YgbK (DUF1537 family)
MITTRSHRPDVLGIVADDLTGAADSAVSFAEHGWRVELHLHPDRVHIVSLDPPTPTVLAVSTEARALTDVDAATITAAAVATLRAAGAERCYLKIDSTLRGSVAGQVTGALRVWPSDHADATAVICPAFPEHRRTVVDGRLLVDGVPLEKTPAAVDPVTPRTISDLSTIVLGAERGTTAQIGLVERLLLDATADTDLDEIATRLEAVGPAVVMVGSGGLAAALARRWAVPQRSTAPLAAGSGRVLVAVSSLHPVTAAQLAQLRATAPAAVDVLTTPSDISAAPSVAAATFADRVAAAITDHTYSALIAVGGDGAAAILHRLSADHIIIDGDLNGGCPTGIIGGGHADGLRLVTKSGGFGDPATLITIINRLRIEGAKPEPARVSTATRSTQEEES